mgnify:CR=1 FL=1
MREIKLRAWWKHPKYNPKGKMYLVGGLNFTKIVEEGEVRSDIVVVAKVEVPVTTKVLVVVALVAVRLVM